MQLVMQLFIAQTKAKNLRCPVPLFFLFIHLLYQVYYVGLHVSSSTSWLLLILSCHTSVDLLSL